MLVSETNIKTDKLSVVMDALNHRSAVTGQDFLSYLEGQLVTNYTNYWDYIHLDLLLNLQQPKTSHTDEKIFIIYHQICELLFNLVIHEIDQVLKDELYDLETANQRVERVNGYYGCLINTFPILVSGMHRESFQVFRKALYPASGQQSFQFRLIEIFSTDFANLVHYHGRASLTGKETTEELYDKLYWQNPHHKSATLKQFEEKYYESFILQANKHIEYNLAHFVNKNRHAIARHEITESLKEFDINANVRWPFAHFKCVAHNLGKSTENTTGNTDWQKYLHPKYRKIIFFPSLWNETEKANWGAEIL